MGRRLSRSSGRFRHCHPTATTTASGKRLPDALCRAPAKRNPNERTKSCDLFDQLVTERVMCFPNPRGTQLRPLIPFDLQSMILRGFRNPPRAALGCGPDVDSLRAAWHD
jgi:hypothetical protein